MAPGAGSFTRADVHFPSRGSQCAAWLYLPDGVHNPPVVILGHGAGATRELRLDAYAERFAAAGMAVLAFTYRHFGDSGASPRQYLSVRHQLQDWDAAIAYVKSCSDLDGRRVAVWGSSFGGGHAVTVAARHGDLAAAVAQCPFTDGLASARVQGLRAALALGLVIARDLVAAVVRRRPVTVPIVGPPGSVAVMNSADALGGYRALIPAGTPFVNEVAARSLPAMIAYRPGRAARRVQLPILFCISSTDSVTPAGPTVRYARTAPHATIVTDDAGHFDFYLGEPFDRLVDIQTAFLQRHLLRL